MVPTEYKIEWAVKQLRNHRYKGPSKMRAENIKGCLAEARNKEREEAAAEQRVSTLRNLARDQPLVRRLG